MTRLVILLILLFSLFFSSCTRESVKYDYVTNSNIKSNEIYYSVIQNYYADSIVKKYFIRLDTLNNIKGKEASFEQKENFNDSIHNLFGTFILKTKDKYLNTTWRSPYEQGKCDSLNITLSNIIDTVIQGRRFERCYVYSVKYDKYSMIDEFDFNLHFDIDKRIVLKKVYYQGVKEKGKEELIRFTKL